MPLKLLGLIKSTNHIIRNEKWFQLYKIKFIALFLQSKWNVCVLTPLNSSWSLCISSFSTKDHDASLWLNKYFFFMKLRIRPVSTIINWNCTLYVINGQDITEKAHLTRIICCCHAVEQKLNVSTSALICLYNKGRILSFVLNEIFHAIFLHGCFKNERKSGQKTLLLSFAPIVT